MPPVRTLPQNDSSFLASSYAPAKSLAISFCSIAATNSFRNEHRPPQVHRRRDQAVPPAETTGARSTGRTAPRRRPTTARPICGESLAAPRLRRSRLEPPLPPACPPGAGDGEHTHRHSAANTDKLNSNRSGVVRVHPPPCSLATHTVFSIGHACPSVPLGKCWSRSHPLRSLPTTATRSRGLRGFSESLAAARPTGRVVRRGARSIQPIQRTLRAVSPRRNGPDGAIRSPGARTDEPPVAADAVPSRSNSKVPRATDTSRPQASEFPSATETAGHQRKRAVKGRHKSRPAVRLGHELYGKLDFGSV